MLCKMIDHRGYSNHKILDSQYNMQRISAIEKVMNISKENNINIKCVYKAIYFFDKIIYTSNKFNIKEYNLLIFVCLILACKIFDFGKQAMHIILCMNNNNICEAKELENYEMIICEYLDWNLHISTAYDFLDYFNEQGIFDYKEITNIKIFKNVAEELIKQKLKNVIIFLLNTSIKSKLI